eukprot:XP_001694604.1 predicted protein [Chlamydomonas reinhardtii]
MQSHAACLWLLGLLVVSQGCGASAGLESVWRISSTQLGRKLTQATGATSIVPLLVDQSPCAALNADDAAPLLAEDNSTLGWATIQQGGAFLNGSVVLQVDLTAHVSGMYLADSSSTQVDASNVRACIVTDKPDACPVTRQLMYHFPRTADCTRRRATLDFAIPPNIFNCSYATPEDYEATFYLQLEVDLSFDTCLPPDGKYYAGSRRKAISPGCSYITVTAQCTPSTCERPTLSAEELAAQSGGGGSSSSLMPVIVGVSVGTTVLVLAILGGVLYMRKRQRDEAMRRKLQHKYSSGMEGGEDELVDTEDEDLDPEDDYELDFSGKSNATAAFGGLGRNSIFAGRSVLFSRSHRSTVGGRSLTALGGGGGYYQGGMGGSMIVPPGGGYVGGGYMGGGYGTSIYASATGAAMMGMGVARRGGMQSEIQPSYMIGSGGSVVGGEYRTPGARRFSTKYERRDTAGPGHSQPMSPGGGAYGQPMSPGGGAYGLPMSPGGAGYGQPMSPGGAAYGHAPYGRNSIAASYSLAFTGRDSAAISHLHPQPEIELHEDNYQLARMSTKMMSAGGAAGSGSAAGSPAGMTAGRKSPSLPRPAAAVTGRSVAQVAAELGLESPSGAAGHSVTRLPLLTAKVSTEIPSIAYHAPYSPKSSVVVVDQAADDRPARGLLISASTDGLLPDDSNSGNLASGGAARQLAAAARSRGQCVSYSGGDSVQLLSASTGEVVGWASLGAAAPAFTAADDPMLPNLTAAVRDPGTANLRAYTFTDQPSSCPIAEMHFAQEAALPCAATAAAVDVDLPALFGCNAGANGGQPFSMGLFLQLSCRVTGVDVAIGLELGIRTGGARGGGGQQRRGGGARSQHPCYNQQLHSAPCRAQP